MFYGSCSGKVVGLDSQRVSVSVTLRKWEVLPRTYDFHKLTSLSTQVYQRFVTYHLYCLSCECFVGSHKRVQGRWDEVPPMWYLSPTLKFFGQLPFFLQ